MSKSSDEKLYQVQDSDRPMWVIAKSFSEAARRWRAQIAKENPDDECKEYSPDGITFIAEGADIERYPNILL